MTSRSSIFRKCREFLKRKPTDDSYETLSVAKRTQERVNEFLDEKIALSETLEENYYSLMLGSPMYPLEFVKEIGMVDSELPGKNPNQFEQLLDYFWYRVADYEDAFDEVLDSVCNAFPNYERKVLKSAYLAFEDGRLKPDSDLTTLLERMADFDEIEGIDHFSSNVDAKLPCELQEPTINICNHVCEIINFLVPFSPFADIIWVLNNRFGIDREYLEELVLDKICELYGEYNCDELVMNYSFNELFKLSDGYKMFLYCLPTILQKGISERAVRCLSLEHGINVDIELFSNMDE